MEKSFEILQSLIDAAAQDESEQAKLRRRKQDAWYLIPDYEEPQQGFHLHFCRLCSDEIECLKDECYWTYEYICHNCYTPEVGLSSRVG